MTSSAPPQELAFWPASSTLAGLADGLQDDLEKVIGDGKAPAGEQSAAKLLLEAEGCMHKEDAQGAMTKAKEAVAAYRDLGNSDSLASALRVVILVHCYEGRHAEGAALAKSGQAEAKGKGSKRGEAKLMLAEAEALFGQKGFAAKDAMRLATAAKDTFRSEGDILMEGRANLAILDMHIKRSGDLKDRGQAMWKVSMEAQDLFTQIGSRRGIALSFHGLAGAHAFRDSIDNAARAGKEALNLFKTLEIARLEALELENIARLHLYQAEPEQALPFAERALKAAQRAGGAAAGAWEVQVLEIVVDAHLAQGTVAQGKQTAEQALKRFHAAGNKLGEATVLQMLARVHIARDDFSHALSVAHEAAGLHSAIKNKKGEAGSLRLVAQILISRGDSDEAIEVARKAVKLSKQLPDAAEQALCLRVLTQACLAEGDVDGAARTASEECALHRDGGSKQKEALSMLSSCSIYTSAGDFEKVVATAADAQQLGSKAGDARVEAKAWQTIAEAQLAAEKLSAALWALDRAKKLYQEVGDKKQSVSTRLLIAQANFQQAVQNEEKGGAEADTQKMVENAFSEASDAIDLARSQGDEPQVAAALMTLAKAQTAVMLFPDALKSAGEAAEIYRASGDSWGEGSAHSLCAHVHMLNEHPGRAGRAACQAMLLFQKCRDFQAEAWAAGVFDRIAEARRTRPPATFLAGTSMKKSAGMPKVGPGLGLPASMIFDDELEFDAPLMQAGLCPSMRPTLSGALAKQLMQMRTGAPALLSK